MMMVPRSYAQAAPRKPATSEINEKSRYRSTRSPSNSPQARSPLSSSLFESRDPSPIRLESHTPKSQSQLPSSQNGCTRPPPTPLFHEKEVARIRRESAKDLLSSTAIPIRRKPKGRPSQRLPKGDHVANFSNLLMNDIKPAAGGTLSRSISNSNFEGLFGNMDELLEEGQMYVDSEGLDSGIMSTRSLSDDSLVSLPSPDDFPCDDRNSQHSSVSQSIPDRKFRQMATSEDCSDDHPLSRPGEEEDLFNDSSRTSPTPMPKSLAGRSEKKPRLSLTSSLTASLKALKSAAQSVSNRSTNDSIDIKARSFFDFHPALTDDRRPPPSLDTPTPELRRYLNPPPLDSAAQLHFWQDHRHSKFEKSLPQKESKRRALKNKKSPLGRTPSPPGSNPILRDLPAVVQLASCLPPSVRTEHASSPPIWLTQDGTPVNKNTAVPLLFNPDANGGKGELAAFRHREPRENSDFLRVFVCEMEMRRHGKLSEDLSAGRARLWLPPVNESAAKAKPRKEGDLVVVPPTGRVRKKKAAKDRMMCLSIEDM